MNISYVQIHFTEVSAHYLTAHNIVACIFNATAASISNCMPLHNHAQAFLPLKDIANTFVVLDSFLKAHNTNKTKNNWREFAELHSRNHPDQLNGNGSHEIIRDK